jgi:predicted dienelactone hydrolase
MKKLYLVSLLPLLLFSISTGCVSANRLPSSTTSLPSLVVTPAATIQPPAAPTPTPGSQVEALFPLAETGPYWVGQRSYTLVDPERNGREIQITVWYPALEEFNADNQPITRDANPDLSGASYPVILTGRNTGDYVFKSHLASQGFVMVIVKSPDFSYEDPWDLIVIDGPRDFLFTLDQLSSSPPPELENLMDTDRTGVAGYSWDGFFSLALGGVRIDPEFYLSQCAQAPSLEPPLSPWMFDYYCSLAAKWDQFAAYAGDKITSSTDGLWQPLRDDRILAVMPMAPDGAWLYGDKGLAALDMPTLIISGTNDEIYKMETSYIFDHLTTPDRFLISFIGQGHLMVLNAEPAARINHFASAFFGYYLQGRQDYRDYFSQEFVSRFADLAWGVYDQ